MHSHVLKVHDPKENGMIATHSDLVAFFSSLEFLDMLVFKRLTLSTTNLTL